MLLAVLAGIYIGSFFERLGGVRAIITRVAAKSYIILPPEHDLSRLVWSHWDTRRFLIGLQAAETPPASILLLGDSVIEGLWTNTLTVRGHACFAVNAGFAGIGVAELQRLAAPLLARLKPRFALLYVGINDAWPDADAKSWAAHYDALVDMTLRSGATVVLSTILPPEPGFANSTKSSQTVEQFNNAIRMIGKTRNLVVADVAIASQEDNPGPGRLTVDGVHPTGAFYHSLVERWLVPALETAQGVRREDCISSF